MSIFDHSHALLGSAEKQGKQHLSDVRDQLALGGHCLLGCLLTDKHFQVWKDRIQQIPDFFLEDTVHHVVGLGIDSDEEKAIVEFLRHRRDHLSDLITTHKNEFTGVKQWSLL